MPERKFVNTYEIDIKKLCSLITHQLLDGGNGECYELFNSEDDATIKELEYVIDNITSLDERSRNNFIDDVQLAMCTAAKNAFENGLQVGLSLLQSLLTAELPEIHTVRHEPSRTKRNG
ncbi:MAG: hypothetical protein NC489_12095 [Ruminococcus flavefaciens]|nr:hypothetical protein [Ruminococcus flavefaciens]